MTVIELMETLQTLIAQNGPEVERYEVIVDTDIHYMVPESCNIHENSVVLSD